jgi:predicted ATPase/DNA-binding SARP family transcriptional activator
MRYGLLGPLELSDEGRSIEVAGAKLRMLLAVLLLNGNRVVSTDTLIESLWEGRAPKTAAKAVQVLVSQLRKLLGPERLATRSPGYLLRVEEGELDSYEFEALLQRARAQPAADIAAVLSDALALWRGPPLADFAFDRFALAEIARLEELRLEALEERLEADLVLGRHSAVIGELEALVGQHPLRERLRGQLMLALYRSGRQAEALDAYRDARRALVEELGIEPTHALRELEAAILRQDPALDLRAPARLTEGDVARATSGQAAEPPAGRERKLATVLFADLVGSTEIGEQDPERTRALLERFYAAMADEIERAGGTVEKFVGDAVMAAFGVPAAQEDHAERALHAALAMRARFEEMFGAALGLRLGVNTGNVVTGAARGGGSFATGDAVNVAARLEQAAAPGEILVGERTVADAGRAFEFGDALLAEAKGKSQGVYCRPLLGAATLTRPRGIGGMRRTFVGREAELELMVAAYERAVRSHELHLVTVVGDAGVGKTSLVGEFRDWLRGQPQDPRVLSGRCLAYGRGITYWPLGEVLKEHFGLLESDPPDVVHQRLGDRQILGLTLGLDVAGDLHPLVARERLNASWVELLDDVASVRPAVIVVEDLHWAEEPLLDLLENLLHGVTSPFLLLATARPELLDRRSAWAATHRNATRLWLEPLSREEAARMLDELLGPGLPRRLGQLVLEQAEGNPFFLEELVAALIDRGFLLQHDGGWKLRELPAGFAIPDSIESILAARIDLLGPSEKAALQAASVVGRVFWPGPVLELLAGLEADWGVLVGRDFIRRRRNSSMAGEGEFAFKHALTRDVAYESLPKGTRARLHAAFAAWIERRGAERDEYAPLLAHHYAEAVKPDDRDLAWPDRDAEVERLQSKALHWLRRSADLAAARYAIDEQISLLERAVAIEPNQTGQVKLWRTIAHAHALTYDDDAFRDAMRKAIDVCSDETELAELYAEGAFQCAVRWQQEIDRDQIDQWSEAALETAGRESRARAQALVARAICHPTEAEANSRAAEALAVRLQDPESHSYALYIRADIALAAADYEEAQRIVEERLGLLHRVDDPDHHADAYWAALPAYLGNGRFDKAREIAHRHDEITQQLTAHHRLHGVAVLLEVEQLAGNWQRIRALTARAEQAVDQNTTRCLHNRLALLTCALASAYLGADDEARRLEARSEESGVDLYGRAESLIWLSLHRSDLAEVERLLGELERPRKSLLRSRKLAPVVARLDALAALGNRQALEHDALPRLRPCTYLEPFALRALGVVRKDERLIEQAMERFERLGLEWHAAQTRTRLEEKEGAPALSRSDHPGPEREQARSSSNKATG